MADEVRFRSDILVRYVRHCGDDAAIAQAAWVDDPAAPPPPGHDQAADAARVIRAMMKGRHGSPFEHGLLTVYVEAPVVVWWEWTRHRFMALGCPDMGFNLESGRYKVLEPEFYVPPPGRPLMEPDGFRPMRPEHSPGTAVERELTLGFLQASARQSWAAYRGMIESGVGREVARLVLPFNTYYAGYVSANPRTWLQFFSLRRASDKAAAPTFPQWEIAHADEQAERIFAGLWPLTYAAFEESGRVPPGA